MHSPLCPLTLPPDVEILLYTPLVGFRPRASYDVPCIRVQPWSPASAEENIRCLFSGWRAPGSYGVYVLATHAVVVANSFSHILEFCLSCRVVVVLADAVSTAIIRRILHSAVRRSRVSLPDGYIGSRTALPITNAHLYCHLSLS